MADSKETVEIVLEEEPNEEEEAGFVKEVNMRNILNADQLGADSGFTDKGDDLFGAVDEEGVEFMAVKPWKGAIVAPTSAPADVKDATSASLQMDWIYGYRGYDSRQNVFLNSNGHVVYPIASVVVVYDPVSNTQQHYTGQNDDVICLAQHPTNPNIFASGQVATIVNRHSKQPHITIWDSTDFKKKWVLDPNGQGAHQRAVRTLGFSCDGKLLASVGEDDNHTIKVWDWQSQTLIATAKGDTQKIMHLAWDTKNPKSFTTVGIRHIFTWTLADGALKKAKASLGEVPWQTFYNVTYSDKGFPCVGCRDGSLYILGGGAVKKVMKGLHKSDVHAVFCHANGIVTGGGDGICYVMDSKLAVKKALRFKHGVRSVYMAGNTLVIGTYGGEIHLFNNWETAPETPSSPIVRGHFDGELWAVAPLQDGQRFVSAGEDNMILMWDIKSHKVISEGVINPKKGTELKVKRACTTSKFAPNQCVRAVDVSPDGRHIAVGTNKGELSVFDAGSLQLIVSHDLNAWSKRQVIGQTENWIQTVKYNPQGNILAVGNHASTIVLCDVKNNYTPKKGLDKHNSFITNMDWTSEGNALRSTCGAYELLFFNVASDFKSSSQNTSGPSMLRDSKWASHNCLLTWGTQGVFDPSQDGSDVNTGDMSKSGKIYVTGDDYGDVVLWRFPVQSQGHKEKRHKGHSSHVMSVRFTKDDAYVISAGGNDKAIIQWRVVA